MRRRISYSNSAPNWQPELDIFRFLYGLITQKEMRQTGRVVRCLVRRFLAKENGYHLAQAS